MDSKLVLKIFVEPNGKCPTKGKPGDAAFDLYADIENSIVVKQGESVKIPLGFCIAPFVCKYGSLIESTDYWFEIKNRSGVGMKSGMVELAAVVDSNYRGIPNWCAAKVTTGEYTIEPGAKIAQMLIHPFTDPHEIEIIVVDTLEELGITSRGASGFGGSGQ